MPGIIVVNDPSTQLSEEFLDMGMPIIDVTLTFDLRRNSRLLFSLSFSMWLLPPTSLLNYLINSSQFVKRK
jgi:hypothetical protein